MGISLHTAPYCWGKINKSQDDIMKAIEDIKCPHCGQTVSNEDVTDPIQLVDCISLIKVSPHSTLKLFRERRV